MLSDFINTVKTVYIVCMVYSFYKRITSRKSGRIGPLNQTRKELRHYEKIFRGMQSDDPEHFSKATRMDRAQFNLLLTLLTDRLARRSARRPISPENRLAITLMYLAHGCSMNILAWSYKIGFSTVRAIILETCTAIWDQLHNIYVAFPTLTEWENITREYQNKTGMPHCLGAIDGKHVYVTLPTNSGDLYYNYKGRFSIVMLAACDANYSITAVEVGAYGSESEGGIFAKSNLGQQLLNGKLPIPPPREIAGTNKVLPFYFLGDTSFPLKPNLMRPYPGVLHLDADKKIFNEKLSSGRCTIENVFGILVNRWRILGMTINMAPENAEKVVLATVVLHNFLKFHGDAEYFQADYVDQEDKPGRWRNDGLHLQSARLSRMNRSASNAFQIRESLKEYLKNNHSREVPQN